MASHDASSSSSAPRVYPGKSPFAMLSVDECAAIVARQGGAPLDSWPVPLGEALGCTLAHDVPAPKPVPSFPASIMDGFAVRAADGPGRFPVDVLAGATAGAASHGPLPQGHVRYITTGAPLPPDADAVVKVEDTSEIQGEGGQLEIDIAVCSKPGANIRQIGSDTKQGEVVLHGGAKIGAAEIGVLAALGFALVDVCRRPKVVVLSTGDELVDACLGDTCVGDDSRGQVFDCNRPMLCALVKEAGAEALDFGIVNDDPEHLRKALTSALAAADIVITSGGVSRGSKDHIKSLLSELGQVHFGEMCMKPGKPTTFATVPAPDGAVSERLVFGLPGNPVSCFVTFKLLVVPAIQQLLGSPSSRAVYPRVKVELEQPIEMDPQRPEYHRARTRWENGRLVAESSGFQRSSRIASIAEVNSLLEIPSSKGVLPKGTLVTALLLSGAAGGAGLRPEPEGFPGSHQPMLPQLPLQQSQRQEQRQAPQQPQQPEQKRHCQRVHCVGLLAVGSEGASAAREATAALRAVVGAEELDLLEQEVPADAQAVRNVLELWGGGSSSKPNTSDADAMECLPAARHLVVVLGRFGLSAADAAVATALRDSLHQEAPGVADLALRAGLARTPLAMLTQVVAGYRNQTLMVAVPTAAPAEYINAVWKLMLHDSS